MLIRSYAFELRDGPDTKLEIKRGLSPRPSVVGEEGAKLPLKVRRLD